MKVISKILTVIVLLTGCNNQGIIINSSSSIFSSSIESDKKEEVTLTFFQLDYINHAYDDNENLIGYYYNNEVMAKTIFTYEKGDYLTSK